MKILLIILLSILAGVLYRMGGSGRWNTKARDFGVPMCMVAVMAVLGHFHWILIPCFGLLFASLTTYFKKKGKDAFWWNWALVGLATGLSMLPFAILTGCWLGFGARVLVLTIFVTIWSEANGNAVIEEFGRGALIVGTLPLLLIG